MSEQRENWLGVDWLYSTYMWVWAGLFVLTIVEVLVPEPALLADWGLATQGMIASLNSIFTRQVVVVSLILLALAKTFCVAWYYMHLIDERPSIILVACAPFIFSVFLTIGLWPHLPSNSADRDPMESPPSSSVEEPGDHERHAADESNDADSDAQAPHDDRTFSTAMWRYTQ